MKENKTNHLQQFLMQLSRPLKIAVSGGVDSLTLAIFTHRLLAEKQVQVYHAVSPAVPELATIRVKKIAEKENWDIKLINAKEFEDSNYINNPYRRCFYCKSNLYLSINCSNREQGSILSGTNLDDLDDYRPGLAAANNYGVVHPFAECGFNKNDIRELCFQLGYKDLSQLPASPCLSSRVETGISIYPEQLKFVDTIEQQLKQNLNPQVIRCRIRQDKIVIEMDSKALETFSMESQNRWNEEIASMAKEQGLPAQIQFSGYQMGSAFVEQ